MSEKPNIQYCIPCDKIKLCSMCLNYKNKESFVNQSNMYRGKCDSCLKLVKRNKQIVNISYQQVNRYLKHNNKKAKTLTLSFE
jgi:hypothetical protein